MTKVIDASVVLAGIMGEPGGDVLESPQELFHLSAVNLAEVHTKVVERGGTVEDVESFIRPLPLRIRALREQQAALIGQLRPKTRSFGLSLGDRACLALALAIRLRVLTADAKWAELDIGVDIRLIR